MKTLMVLGMIGLGSQLLGKPCRLDNVVVAEQSSDYGPGGTGPSFRFEISPIGKIKLTARRWKLPDGVYTGTLATQDWDKLTCLLAGVVDAFPESPEVWHCPHAPSFSVTDGVANRWLSRCVSGISESPLLQLYDFLPDVVCRARWKTSTPAGPDSQRWQFVSPSPPLCGQRRNAN